MSGAVVVIAIILAVGAVYVLLPLALGAYIRFHRPKEVSCPQTKEPATVRLDARHAAATSVTGATRLTMLGCSNWPERRDCDRACLNQLAP